VISNGVINLKPAVFAAAARALRPGGRLALADIVTAEQLPKA
jgi:arsenite methyltransferase